MLSGYATGQVDPDILKVGEKELNYWFSKFVVEIRKKQEPGRVYPPNTLYQICCGLQWFLRNNGQPALNIFEQPMFKGFQDCLDAEMERLTSCGVGATVKEAESLFEGQEEKL